MMKKSRNIEINRFILTAIFASILCLEPMIALGQDSAPPQPKPAAQTNKTTAKPAEVKKKKYQDEYQDLDEKVQTTKTRDAINTEIKKADSYYKRALRFVKNRDVTSADKFFKSALKILSDLENVNGIENFDNYYDLLQSIIDDYETFVANIDELNEDLPVNIVRNKISREAEKIKLPSTKINSIGSKKDTTRQGKDTPSNLPKIEGELVTIEGLPPFILPKTEIPLDINEHVQKYLTFFSQAKDGRKFMSHWLGRTTKFFPLLRRMAKEEGVPEEIIYLSIVESGLNPTVTSKAGAVGLWQFMKMTAKDYGLNTNSSAWVDERCNPEKATRAAYKFLRNLYSQLGNWHLAFAAYNCGLGRVQRTIRQCKIKNPDFWQLRPLLLNETKHYVPQFIAMVIIASQPEVFKFDKSAIQYQPEYKYETHPVTEPIKLASLAKCAGITEDEIKALNPELIESFTPPDVQSYNLRIPVGSKANFAVNLASLTPEEKQPWIEYPVSKKESLRSIASTYNIPVDKLASLNGISNLKKKLPAGTILRIPVNYSKKIEEANLASNSDDGEDESVEAENTTDQPTQEKTQASDSAPAAPVANAAPTKKVNKQLVAVEKQLKKVEPKKRNKSKKEAEEPDTETRTVKKGESLSSIATQYGISLADLRKLNGMGDDEETIAAGAKIKVPSNSSNDDNDEKPSKKSKKTDKPRIVKHKVTKGETLARIADDYGTTIDAIKKLNGLKKKAKVKPGQTIKVKTGGDYADNSKESRSQSKQVTHKVKKGENLGTIAAKYGVTEEQIKKWNPKEVDGNKIIAGDKLKIRPTEVAKGSSQAASKKVKNLPKSYKVRKGDTVESIAKKFGVSAKSLKKNNKNLTTGKLKAGTSIRIQ